MQHKSKDQAYGQVLLDARKTMPEKTLQELYVDDRFTEDSAVWRDELNINCEKFTTTRRKRPRCRRMMKYETAGDRLFTEYGRIGKAGHAWMDYSSSAT